MGRIKAKGKSKASRMNLKGMNSPANPNLALRKHTISYETIRRANDSIIKDKQPLVDNNPKKKAGHLFISFATGSSEHHRVITPEELSISYNGKIK